MRPASEALPPALYAKLVACYEARRSGAKEAVTMLLDPEVVERPDRVVNSRKSE